MQLILQYKTQRPSKPQLKLQTPLSHETYHSPAHTLQLHFMTLFSLKPTYTATSIIYRYSIKRACLCLDMLPQGCSCLHCSEIIMKPMTQIWRALCQFIIFTYERSMGNLPSTCCSQVSSKHLEDLLSLTQVSYVSRYRLSFDPFGKCCCSPVILQEISPQINSVDIFISKEVGEIQQARSEPEKDIKLPADLQMVAESYQKSQQDLQKNQGQNKTEKKRQIKKIKKPIQLRVEARIQPTFDPEQAQFLQEPETQTSPDDSIRDQNNCKSYHKLVKNYLEDHNLGHLLKKYQRKYHTRYYFIVALIFIKYYVKQDFTEDYIRIVREELETQERKIERKLIQKEKIEKRIKQASSSRVNIGELREKRQKLQKQIEHIKVVKKQIEQFSVRSCSTFFQGEIEESLKILYLKDDPVMRKKYYFDSALRTVQQILIQVRKASQNS